MKIRMIAAIVAALAAFALPATASAHKRVSPRTVKSHVTKAQSALSQLSQDAGSDQAQGLVDLFRNRVHSKAAFRDVKRLKSTGSTGTESLAALMQKVAKLFDLDVESYTGLVDQTSGDLQGQLSAAIAEALKLREQVLDSFAALAQKLPADLQAQVAQVIASITGNSDDEVSQLTDSVQSGKLPVDCAKMISDAIGIATDAVSGTIDTLGGLTQTLPAAAQPFVQQALKMVTGAMDSIKQIVSGLFSHGGSTADNGDAGSKPQAFPIPMDLISQVMGIFKGLPIPSFGGFGV